MIQHSLHLLKCGRGICAGGIIIYLDIGRRFSRGYIICAHGSIEVLREDDEQIDLLLLHRIHRIRLLIRADLLRFHAGLRKQLTHRIRELDRPDRRLEILRHVELRA